MNISGTIPGTLLTRKAIKSMSTNIGNLQAPYSIEKGSFCIANKNRDGSESLDLLTNFIAWINEVVQSDQGASLKISGKLNTGESLPDVSIKAEEFERMNWIGTHWPYKAIVMPVQRAKDHLRVIIQMNSSEVSQSTKFSATGWHKNSSGEWVYAYQGGYISTDGLVSEKEIDLKPVGAQYTNFSGCDRACTSDDLKNLFQLADDKVILPLLAGVFRSVVAEFLPLNFSMYLFGESGTRKSSVAAIIQSFFGKSYTTENLPGSWSSTENALEMQSHYFKDTIFTIDDYALGQTTTENTGLQRKAERVFRGQGNGSGRARMNGEGGLQETKKCRGLILVTAEEIPEGESINARLYLVPMLRSSVDINRLTLAQKAAGEGVYANLMRSFIQWYARRAKILDLGAMKRNYIEQYRDNAGHGRDTECIADLTIGSRLFLDFCLDAQLMTAVEGKNLETKLLSALNISIQTKNATSVTTTPELRFITLLQSALATSRARVVTLNDEPNKGVSHTSDRGRLVGWQDTKYLYLNPDAAYTLVYKMAIEQGKHIGASQRALWQKLNRAGISSCETNKSLKKKLINGKRIYCLQIPQTSLSESIEEPFESDVEPTHDDDLQAVISSVPKVPKKSLNRNLVAELSKPAIRSAK